jgi:hypothetical protein
MLSLFGDLTVSITINHAPTDRRQREALSDIERCTREITDLADPELAENAAGALWDLLLERKMRLKGPAKPGYPINPFCP